MCKIVYEDNHLLVVVKPPNLLTQGDATGDACLLDKMKQYLKQRYQKPAAVYLGCVHRLDRPVGGLVALAKTSKAASRLSEQLRSHLMQREYLAIVVGAGIMEAGERRDWLAKDGTTGSVRCVDPETPGAQEAVLSWRRMAFDAQADLALLHVRLHTGRKHQIRVQLAQQGHPILYDMRYGTGVQGETIALWGAILTLLHPTKKIPLTFVSRPQGSAYDRFAPEIGALLTDACPHTSTDEGCT